MIEMKIFTLLAIIEVTLARVYFQESFDDGWKNRWVESSNQNLSIGKFEWSAGEFYGDSERDKGIQTSEDAKFYGLSAKFDSFSNKGKNLVIQFTVKHEQNIDCGGGYIKLFPSTLNQKDMNGDSPYNIMFGPDICGPGTKKVHVIFNYKGNYLFIKKDILCKTDVFTHLYTLILKPDNTYEVKIDNSKVESGHLEEDWDFLPPKKINNLNIKKPDDWDDRQMIDDPEDSKPDNLDKPIADSNVVKPGVDQGGDLEQPLIDNPEDKGEWTPRQIYNPKYQGEWVHPKIDNPKYVPDDKLYFYKDIGVIGFDIFQVKAGTIFDNILITDDIEYARKVGDETWGVTKKAEKKMNRQQDKEEGSLSEDEEVNIEEEEKLDDHTLLQFVKRFIYPYMVPYLTNIPITYVKLFGFTIFSVLFLYFYYTKVMPRLTIFT